jgi:hypothetical protein
MAESPIRAVLRALDALDAGTVLAMFAADGTLLRTDGYKAEGIDAVRAAVEDFLKDLRGTEHEVTAEWNPEPGVWIAQLMARYELSDFGRHGPYPRAVVLREGPDGITELSFYGSHELPLAAAEHSYRDVYAAGRWMPTL